MKEKYYQELAFLNQNTRLKLEPYIILYDVLEFWGIVIYFETQNLQNVKLVTSEFRKVLQLFTMLTNSTTCIGTLELFLVGCLNLVLLLFIALLQNFSARPSKLLSKIGISVISLLCFCHYCVIDVFFEHELFDEAKEECFCKNYFEMILLMAIGIFQLFFNMKYRESLICSEIDTSFIIAPEILMISKAIHFVFIVTCSLFPGVKYLLEILGISVALIYLVFLFESKALRLMKSEEFLHIFCCIVLSSIICESVIELVCIINEEPLNTDYCRLGVFVVSIILNVALCLADEKIYIDIIPNSKLIISKSKKYESALSKQLILLLSAYYGPECVGIVNSNNYEDVSKESIDVESISEDDANALAIDIGKCEEELENFKILYEKIYANIYLNYSLCGETLEHISLFDIEEALSIPFLLFYLRIWKSPKDAFISIIHYMKQLNTISDIKEEKNETQENDILSILRENCIKQNLFSEGINIQEEFMAALEKERNRDRNSINPDLNLFQTNYEYPSDQQFSGGLYILKKSDFANNEYLIKHLVNTKSTDYLFVFVPTITSVSYVTGNLHRLSFNNQFVSSRTASLRELRLFALISLARVMFPLSRKLDKQFRFPLVGSFYFAEYGAKSSNKYMGYSQEYLLDPSIAGRRLYKAAVLYTFAPFLSKLKQKSFANSQDLQASLVEYLLYRQVAAGEASPRLFKYLNIYYNESGSAIHKLMLLQRLEFDSKEICELPNEIVINALTVQLGSAIIDDRATPFSSVVKQLVICRKLFVSKSDCCMYSPWIAYMQSKLRLYQMAEQRNSSEFAGIESAYLHACELARYNNFIDEIEETSLKWHHNNQKNIAEFICEHKKPYYRILQAYEQSSALFLINQDSFTEGLDYEDIGQEVFLPSIELLFESTIETDLQLKQIFSEYSFVRLSNHIYYLQQEQFKALQRNEKDSIALRADDKPITTSIAGVQALVDFISLDIQQIDSKTYTESFSSSSSFSDSFSFNTDNTSVNEREELLDNDINLSNPEKFEDDFALTNTNFYAIDDDNVLFYNHQPEENTPEFAISVIKYDFECMKHESIEWFYQLLFYLSQLHYIKIHDNSIRVKNQVFYILPRICNLQSDVENSVEELLTYIANIKNSAYEKFNSELLEEALASVNIIEKQISRLFEAESELLGRKALTDDTYETIKETVQRSFDLTYGEEFFEPADAQNEREKMIDICDVYSGMKFEKNNIVEKFESKECKVGGIHAYEQVAAEGFHPSWRKVYNFFELSHKQKLLENIFMNLTFLLPLVLSVSLFIILASYQLLEQNAETVFYEEFERISESITGLTNIVDDVGISYERKYFNANNNATFINLNFNKAREIQEELFITHLFSTAAVTQNSFLRQLQKDILKNTSMPFYINYDNAFENINNNPYLNSTNYALNSKFYKDIQSYQLSKRKAAGISWLLFREEESKQFANITSINITRSFKIPIKLHGEESIKIISEQPYDFLTLDKMEQLTLIEIIEYYAEELNILIHEAFTMELKFSTEKYELLLYELEKIQQSYDELFCPIMEKAIFVIRYENECIKNLLFDIFSFLFLVSCNVIFYKFEENIIYELVHVDIERASIIASIIDLPLELLESIHDRYRRATQLTNTTEELFSVKRKVLKVEKIESPPENVKELRICMDLLKSCNTVINKTFIPYSLLFIVFFFLIKIIADIITLTNISGNYEFNRLDTFNLYENKNNYYELLPLIRSSKIDEKWEAVERLDNSELLEKAEELGIPFTNYIHSYLDQSISASQIVLNILYLEYCQEPDESSSELEELFPLYSALNIFNELKSNNRKVTELSHLERELCKQISAFECSRGLHEYACEFLDGEETPVIDYDSILEIIKSEKRELSYKSKYNIDFIVLSVTYLFLLSISVAILVILCEMYVEIKKLKLTDINQEEYETHLAKILYSKIDISLYIVLTTILLCLLLEQTHIYILGTVAFFNHRPCFEYYYQEEQDTCIFECIFLTVIIQSLEQIVAKAFAIIESVGVTEDFSRLKVTERLEFGQELYVFEDKDEIRHPECTFITSSYLLPYPEEEYNEYKFKFISNVLILLCLFSIWGVCYIMCRIIEPYNEHIILSNYQSTVNELSTLASKYYTHKYSANLYLNEVANIELHEEYYETFLYNNKVLMNSLMSTFTKSSEYLHPTFYEFTEYYLDNQFYNSRTEYINKANFNFNDIAEPSLLHGIHNISRFLQLEPPRNMSYGIHLETQNTKYLYPCTIISSIEREKYNDIVMIMKPYKDLSVYLEQMLPNGEFENNFAEMNGEVVNEILTEESERESDFWHSNYANNREIYNLVNEALSSELNRNTRQLLISSIITIIITIILIVISAISKAKNNKYIEKQELFTSLFLKRIRGIQLSNDEINNEE